MRSNSSGDYLVICVTYAKLTSVCQSAVQSEEGSIDFLYEERFKQHFQIFGRQIIGQTHKT